MTPVPPGPDDTMFLRLPVRHRDWLLAALHHAGYHDDAKQVEAFTRDYVDPVENAERLAWLERARDRVGRDGEIEFDDDATYSKSPDNGEYVLGWVWVDGDDPEDATDTADTAELRGGP